MTGPERRLRLDSNQLTELRKLGSRPRTEAGVADNEDAEDDDEVIPAGLEPTTSALGKRRSIH